MNQGTGQHHEEINGLAMPVAAEAPRTCREYLNEIEICMVFLAPRNNLDLRIAEFCDYVSDRNFYTLMQMKEQ